MNARIATWWVILRVALEERLVYRGDFALGTLMRFLPIITQIFLWGAILQTVDSVAGYSFENMVAYYLLTMVGRAFSSMPGLASGIAVQIRNGEIKKFLIQPIDLISFLLLNRIAHKLAYYSVVFFLCRWTFVDGWPDWTAIGGFLLALVFGFLLGFFMETTIGMVGFWFLDVSSLLFVYMLLSFFLSGHMFPLDMLPEFWGDIVDLLPLKYLAYFPAAVFLGKIKGPELVWGLCVEAAWIVFFVFASRVAFQRGLHRYSGFGG